MELITDMVHDHYQLLSVGWNKLERIHSTLIHIDIRDGKIWIQQDGTEEGIANRLVELGVSKAVRIGSSALRGCDWSGRSATDGEGLCGPSWKEPTR